jgi:hypothetical protein
MSFVGEDSFELALDCMVLAANQLDQVGHCFEVAAASGGLGVGERRGENSRVNCPRARFERVRGGLDCLGITALHRVVEGRKARGRIFHERREQSAEHLFHAAFAQLRAKALDIDVW